MVTANVAGVIKWTHVQYASVYRSDADPAPTDELVECLKTCEYRLEHCQSIAVEPGHDLCDLFPASTDESWNISPSREYDFYYICAFGELDKPGT